jgi:hypothetical protein
MKAFIVLSSEYDVLFITGNEIRVQSAIHRNPDWWSLEYEATARTSVSFYGEHGTREPDSVTLSQT